MVFVPLMIFIKVKGQQSVLYLWKVPLAAI